MHTALPRRLTLMERILLRYAHEHYPSDLVNHPTSMMRDQRGHARRNLRRILRARVHLVQLGLLRVNSDGCYEATCLPVDRLRQKYG